MAGLILHYGISPSTSFEGRYSAPLSVSPGHRVSHISWGWGVLGVKAHLPGKDHPLDKKELEILSGSRKSPIASLVSSFLTRSAGEGSQAPACSAYLSHISISGSHQPHSFLGLTRGEKFSRILPLEREGRTYLDLRLTQHVLPSLFSGYRSHCAMLRNRGSWQGKI